MITHCSSTISVCVRDSSHVGEARRLATAMASTLGLSAIAVGRVGILVTEITNNILKHAEAGEVLLQPFRCDGEAGLDIVAIDKGRGMADVARCMVDGYSTAGSPGTGLGAMSRLSTTFDILSKPNDGTGVLCRVLPQESRPTAQKRIDVGGLAVPVNGEQVCGDAWAQAENQGRTSIIVADGLGHGQFASEAAEVAVGTFTQYSQERPAEIIGRAHGRMRATRGAAVAIAEINPAEQSLRFAGIGNIAAAILNGSSVRNLLSHNGTLGVQMHKVQELSYPWLPGSVLVMNSDGILTKWMLENSPEVRERHPTLIAGVLYRDFRRERDDVTVVVAKDTQTS